MDPRSPKRRKTTPPEAEPKAPARTPTRASFLSPTKASLARFNPGLLPRSGTERRSKSRGVSIGRQIEVVDPDEQLQASAGAQAGSPTEDKDNDLPSIPNETGLQEQDTPRRGTLYSSPSKRPRRGRTTSPLRPRAPPPMNTDDATMTDAQEDGAQDQTEVPVEEARADAAAVDPEVEKKKRDKEMLVRELEVLKKEVSRYERAVEVSRKASSGVLPDDIDFDELTSLINSADPSVSAAEETKATPISFLLSSFLPFSKPPAVTVEDSANLNKPAPSHVPLDLDDPLPYLRLFTPFTYKSHISTSYMRGEASTASKLHQIHTIEILEPRKLLSATISITIDTSNQKLVKLSIINLSRWAERELGTWIRGKVLEKDMGAVCWALGSYLGMSVRRAECWAKCQNLLESVREGNKPDSEKPRGRPAKNTVNSDVDAEGNTNDEDAVAGVAVGGEDTGHGKTSSKRKAKVTRKQLLEYLGRDELVFETSETVLKISWDIGFDWTGEAESTVKATAAFPRAWHDVDARNSLKMVPATFDALVRDRGIYESVRAMVGLLFG